jgi:endogenous inhibitor of DNA gyrase (YacG/DUF329 family)
MVLRCPTCQTNAWHVRGDFFGKWVVCPKCERPFAWREAEGDDSPRISGPFAMRSAHKEEE